MTLSPALLLIRMGRTSKASDFPHLAGERDNVGRVPDEFERAGPVQAGHQERKCAVFIRLSPCSNMLLSKMPRPSS